MSATGATASTQGFRTAPHADPVHVPAPAHRQSANRTTLHAACTRAPKSRLRAVAHGRLIALAGRRGGAGAACLRLGVRWRVRLLPPQVGGGAQRADLGGRGEGKATHGRIGHAALRLRGFAERESKMPASRGCDGVAGGGERHAAGRASCNTTHITLHPSGSHGRTPHTSHITPHLLSPRQQPPRRRRRGRGQRGALLGAEDAAALQAAHLWMRGVRWVEAACNRRT
jgi:hypothetical protein